MKTLAIPMLTAGLLVALGGCSAFSTQPEPEVVSTVHQAVPNGLAINEARARLADLGFSCEARRGDYRDESGGNHEDQHFIECTRRPGVVSMACANRDQVIVKPTADAKVGAVEVIRGPHCAAQ